MKEKTLITVSTNKNGNNSQTGHPKSPSPPLACRKIAKQIVAKVSSEMGKYKKGKKWCKNIYTLQKMFSRKSRTIFDTILHKKYQI
jgi:hypothetical protein